MKFSSSSFAQIADPLYALENVRFTLNTFLESCSWVELREQIRSHLICVPLPTITLLPLAACGAVGGNPNKAIVAASASLLLAVSTRWLDDLADRDREDALWKAIGVDRTMTLAAGALTLAWQQLAVSDDVPRELLQRFGATTLKLGAGQDLDLIGGNIDVQEAWEIMRGKTAAGFAFMLESGGLMAKASKLECEILYHSGEHIGVMIQLLDDLDGVLSPNGQGDLSLKKSSNLLLVHALNGSYRDETQKLLEHKNIEVLRSFLIEIGSARGVLAAALQERDLAIATLRKLPVNTSEEACLGRERIINFTIGMFNNLPDYVAFL